MFSGFIYLLLALSQIPPLFGEVIDVDRFFLSLPFQMAPDQHSQYFIRIALKWTNPEDKSCIGQQQSFVHATCRPPGPCATQMKFEIGYGADPPHLVVNDRFLINNGPSSQKVPLGLGRSDSFQIQYNRRGAGERIFYSFNGHPLNTMDPVEENFVAFAQAQPKFDDWESVKLTMGISNYVQLNNNWQPEDEVRVSIYREAPPKMDQGFGVVLATLENRVFGRQLSPASRSSKNPRHMAYQFEDEDEPLLKATIANEETQNLQWALDSARLHSKECETQKLECLGPRAHSAACSRSQPAPRLLFVGTYLPNPDDPRNAAAFSVRYHLHSTTRGPASASPLVRYPLTWTPREVDAYGRSP
ncbi:unnamed protein product, partial [Mesorhabditis spiculigera]